MIKEVDLAAYIGEKSKQKFEWGVCDCILFTADWCERVIGVNPAEGAHGSYSTKSEAYEYLKKHYQNEPERYADDFFKRVQPNFEQVGDIAYCDLNGKKTFGIVGARGFMFFKMDDGILATKQAEKLIAWRVE